MPKNIFKEALESDELLAEVATASSISVLLKILDRSGKVKELHEQILGDAELVEFLESYLEGAIYDETVSQHHVHPKTFEICVGLKILVETGSRRKIEFLTKLGLSESNKFFYCSKLARKLFERAFSHSVVDIPIQSDYAASMLVADSRDTSFNPSVPPRPQVFVEATYGG